MPNIYDVFRSVQSKKDACYDERSAAFIMEGNVSNEVMHVRLNQIKKVALVLNDKEGPDDVIIFSTKQNLAINDFKKGDYFTWNNVYYLIYEDVKLTNTDLPYIKQKAVECNVLFAVGNKVFNGAFFSSLRRFMSNDMLKSSVLISSEKPLIIVPRDNSLVTGIDFVIENKPWKVIDYDNITNKGITYLYIDSFTKETATQLPDDFIPPVEDTTPTLYAMTEYTFETLDAYFASNPKVDIIERKKTSIKFLIPYGIDLIEISIKDELGAIQETVYKVVIS